MPRTGKTVKGQTAGKSAKTIRGKPSSVLIPLTLYDAQNIRNDDQNIWGGVHLLSGGDAINGGDIVVDTGTGRLMLVVNAGGGLSGSILVTGTSVDRVTAVETPADTETLTIDGLSTDTSSTDADGNVIWALSGCPITSKWFTGTVTLSTADVALTDVDVYHLSFNQMNDQPGLTIQTMDCYLHTTNANAEYHAHLYSVKCANGMAAVANIASHNIDSGDAIADTHWRHRISNLAVELDGSNSEGFALDVFAGPIGQQYIDDAYITVWVEVADTVGTASAGPYLLRSASDFATFAAKATPVGADIVLIEDSAAGGSKAKVQLGNITTTNAVTAAAVLAANVIPVGDDGARGIKDNTGGVTLVGTTIAKLVQMVDSNAKSNLFFVPGYVGPGIVNNLFISNADPGSAPKLTASNIGGDGSVDLDYVTKGTGSHNFNNDVDVTGDIIVSGTVDGIDIATDVAANTLKDTNATHTGDVTGSGALAIDPTAISGQGEVTAVAGDYVLLWDATDSLLKKADVDDFGGGGAGDVVGPAGATDLAFARYDTATGKLLQDSKLLGATVGASAASTDLITLDNDVDATAGTETAILFKVEDSGANARDLARITAGVEEAWTAVATTRDSYMAFHTSLDGTVSEAARIHSSGRMVVHNSDEDPTHSTVEYLSVLNVGSSCGIGVYAYRPTATGAAFFAMNRARESGGSPTALVDNDYIARFFARGYDGSTWVSPGRLDWLVDGAVSSGVMPTEFRVLTGSSGSGITRLTVRAAGGVEISGTQTLTFNTGSSIQGATSTQMDIASPTMVLNATTQLLLEKSGDVRFEASATSTNLRISGSTYIDVRTTGIGFFGNAAMLQPDYTLSNVTPDRVLDADSVLLPELADVVGTIIQDLIDYGLYQ